MRVTQRLSHLAEAASEAGRLFGDLGWSQDEVNAIAAASAMIDQTILGREEREGATVRQFTNDELRKATGLIPSTTAEEHVTERIEQQLQWIRAHGQDEDGYIAIYGSKFDLSYSGDGGEAIYAADKAELQRLYTERAKHRHPSQQEVDGVHKAAPGVEEFRCGVCGQRIKRVPGGNGPTFVHADSGAVAAPNPPGELPRWNDMPWVPEVER